MSAISRITTKFILLTGTSIALVASGVATLVSRSAAPLPTPEPAIARVKLQINHPNIRLSEAVALAASGTEQMEATSLTLAAADFDEDGMPDLLRGAVSGGLGFISLYRGNVEAIYPTRQTVTEAASLPFFPASTHVNLPVSPDFLVTGDFDNDGHLDIVTAARGGQVIYLLAGNGKGAFAEAVALDLDGAVTALAAGEINRVDGLPDLAVALKARDGARVLLLSGAEGAWKAAPQSYELAHAATDLEFARLTHNAFSDLAIAAGSELVLLEGGQQTATMTRRALGSVAEALAVGRFTDRTQDQLAVLAQDGSISVLTAPRATAARVASRNRTNANWQLTAYSSAPKATARQESVSSTRQFLRARVSGNAADDLLLLQDAQAQFITNRETPQLTTASLESRAEIVAALPLRTNASAAQGLVFLSRDSAVPLVTRPVPEATFAVTSTADDPDINVGDGICNSSRTGVVCTLRAALQEANFTTGSDTITFTIGAGPQQINLLTPLPVIVAPVILDALTGAPASQLVRIVPPGQSNSQNVLDIVSSGNTIRGLTFQNLNSGFTTILLTGSNDNIIEGNTIQVGNRGIHVLNSARNTIGGTTAAARNVIGGQFGAGILLDSAGANNNQILGNHIGTDAAGTGANANSVGISLLEAGANTIGGTTAAARNVISANFLEGIEIDGTDRRSFLVAEAADGNIVQGNYLGVDATGSGALGNGSGFSQFLASAISIDGASNNTIGGTAANAGNVIANNASHGIAIFPQSFTFNQVPLGNRILGNSISNNGGLGIDLHNNGVTPNDTGDTDTGANTLLNFPTVNTVLTRTTGTTIVGTYNSAPNATYTIELFANAACDASGNGEGLTFIGRTNVTTNASGNGTYTLTATTPIVAGRVITATATDANNNTSEFSPCQTVQDALADLGVTVTTTPATLVVGNNLTYDVTVTNAGRDEATGVTVTNNITIPNGQFTLVSVTPSAGTCTGTGPVTCNLGNLAVNATATIRLIVAPRINTTGTPPQSVSATNTATVASNEVDPNTQNNSASAAATVNASADLAITQSVTPSPIPSGSTVTYTITLTNNGPSTASNVAPVFTPSVFLTNATCTAPAGWSCTRDGNPFFAFTSNFAPGTAVFTVSGTLACLGQNATLTNDVRFTSSTFDPVTTNNSSTLNTPALAGAAVGTIAYDGGGTGLSLGPVAAGSSASLPSGTFTLTNTGCLPMEITTALFQRTTAGLTRRDDSRNFTLRLVPATGAEIPLNPPANPTDRTADQPIPINRVLQAGQQLRFRVTFTPSLPFFAGFFPLGGQPLAAGQFLPDVVNSSVVFNFITRDLSPSVTPEAVGDTGTATALVTGRVSPAIQIIARDGNAVGNPATTPLVIMETIRDDFRVRVSMYDANKNPTQITYQFFDTFRQPASQPLAVSLTGVVGQVQAGQAFTIQQDFSGASGRPDITYVRVVVTDGDNTSVSASSSPFIPALAPGNVRVVEALTADVLRLPTLAVGSKIDLKARREN